jgi:hypothetical protein
MARKKTTKKEAEEETTSKKASKKSKKIQITYKPRFSASIRKSINLKQPKTVAVGDSLRTDYEPKIEGLPMVLTIEKDEIYEVTEEQFKALYEMGFIDTPEDIEERERQRMMVNNQAGANPREFIVAKSRADLYEDNFILVE